MKSKNIFLSLTVITIIGFNIYSCKPDRATCNNCEDELITTVQVHLADSATGTLSTFAFVDPDGDGANAPEQFDTIQLLAGHTYNVSLLILDQSKSPADTTSNEIAAEANDHQFFYHAETISTNFVYEDYDSHTPPMPVGLLSKWYVGSTTGHGKIRITLKHQPGIKDGNEATGSTDVDVNFNAVVQ